MHTSLANEQKAFAVKLVVTDPLLKRPRPVRGKTLRNRPEHTFERHRFVSERPSSFSSASCVVNNTGVTTRFRGGIKRMWACPTTYSRQSEHHESGTPDAGLSDAMQLCHQSASFVASADFPCPSPLLQIRKAVVFFCFLELSTSLSLFFVGRCFPHPGPLTPSHDYALPLDKRPDHHHGDQHIAPSSPKTHTGV